MFYLLRLELTLYILWHWISHQQYNSSRWHWWPLHKNSITLFNDPHPLHNTVIWWPQILQQVQKTYVPERQQQHCSRKGWIQTELLLLLIKVQRSFIWSRKMALQSMPYLIVNPFSWLPRYNWISDPKISSKEMSAIILHEGWFLFLKQEFLSSWNIK